MEVQGKTTHWLSGRDAKRLWEEPTMPCSPPEEFHSNTDLSSIGVYNVLAQDYGSHMGVCGMKSGGGHAADNRLALQGAINAAVANGGGTILIPNGEYAIDGPVEIGLIESPPHSSASLIIKGTDGRARLLLSGEGPLFNVDTDSSAGVVFEDLYIEADSPGQLAIIVSQGQNVRLLRVVLWDARIQFVGASQCSMLECTVTTSSSTAFTAVTIGGAGTPATDICIQNCTLLHKHGVGIGINVVACARLRVVATRLEGFSQGIVMQPTSGDSVELVSLLNVTSYTITTEEDVPGLGAGVVIQPDGGTVTQIEMIVCDFQPPEQGESTYQYGGVYIEGSVESPVDQIRLVSCYSSGWPGPGVETDGGSNIEIIGGCYSCAGFPGMPSPPEGAMMSSSPPVPALAGIVINGSTGVRITGASCTNSVYDRSLGWLPASQDYGVYVTNSTLVSIRDCDLTGNNEGAVYVSGSTYVEVTDCAGYNDTSGVLSPTPPVNTLFSNTYFDYYGPIAFYVSGGPGVAVSIEGASTGLSRGAFALAPNQSAEIVTSAITPTRVAVGQ